MCRQRRPSPRSLLIGVALLCGCVRLVHSIIPPRTGRAPRGLIDKGVFVRAAASVKSTSRLERRERVLTALRAVDLAADGKITKEQFMEVADDELLSAIERVEKSLSDPHHAEHAEHHVERTSARDWLRAVPFLTDQVVTRYQRNVVRDSTVSTLPTPTYSGGIRRTLRERQSRSKALLKEKYASADENGTENGAEHGTEMRTVLRTVLMI